MSEYHKLMILSLIALLLFFACSGGKMPESTTAEMKIKDVKSSEWENLSKKAIYFGHQSVGYNIMEGVQELIKEHSEIRLTIVDTTDASAIGPGTFAHSKVGQNVDPNGKILDFQKILGEGIGQKVNFAALKFCYVDIAGESDVSKLFDSYVNAVEVIKREFPKLTIIHFTAPLTLSTTTWRTWLKKLIGKTDFWEYTDNIKRNEYNILLIDKYGGKEPILDIARIESTRPDGTREAFSLNGKTYYSMVPEYTYDSGHLNEIGRRRVAEQFLILLANLS